MSKITIERKKDRIVIKNRLSYPEALNERVFNAISSGMFESFLPVAVKQKRKDTILECTIQNLTPLNIYFSGIVSRKMFLDFIARIVAAIKDCEKNMINANNIDLLADRIFIDPQSKKLRCIFWPVVNNERDTSPSAFLRQIPYDIVFNEHEGKEYINEYIDFFKGTNPFSINSFDRLINKLLGKNPVELSAPSGAMVYSGELEQKKVIPDSKMVNVEFDPFSVWNEPPEEAPPKKDNDFIYCGNCGTQNRNGSNFCRACGSRLSIPSVSTDGEREKPEEHAEEYIRDGTTVLGDGPGGTTVLGFDEPETPSYPYLIRMRTKEKIFVDKPSFRIGKEERYCDYFVRDNNAVSRSHADIITRGSRYFIIDRHSTNKTYVDGRVIPVEREVEIFSKTRLRLANEDFTFYVE